MKKKTREMIEALERRITYLEGKVEVTYYDHTLSAAYRCSYTPVNVIVDMLIQHLGLKLVKVTMPSQQVKIETIKPIETDNKP